MRVFRSSWFSRFYCGIAVLLAFCAALPSTFAYNYLDGIRIQTSTAEPFQHNRGDAIVLRWAFRPEGTPSSDGSTSTIIQVLDDSWGVPTAERSNPLQQRPWWVPLTFGFDQMTTRTGITWEYTTNFSLADSFIEERPVGTSKAEAELPYDGTGGRVSLGTPWLNTSAANNPFELRKVVAHEFGHSVGLGHTGLNVQRGMMDGDPWPYGMNFDDLYALTRLYGDRFEKNGGNDVRANATPLLNFETGLARKTAVVGSHADNDIAIDTSEFDFVTIDGANDLDYYRIRLDQPAVVDLELLPQGPTYGYSAFGIPNDGASGTIDASSLGALSLQLVDNDGRLVADSGGGLVGQTRSLISTLLEAGDYYALVSGLPDVNQFYRVTAEAATGELIDLNEDSLVNLADYLEFVQHLHTDLRAYSPADRLLRGDFNLDGFNDFQDYHKFRAIYQAVTEAGLAANSGSASVPEPPGLTLLIAAAAALSTGRRRWAASRRP